MGKLVIMEADELQKLIKETIINTFAEHTPEEFITITDAQKLLKCGSQRIKSLLEKGFLKGNNLGKVSKQSIYKFLNVDMEQHSSKSFKN